MKQNVTVGEVLRLDTVKKFKGKIFCKKHIPSKRGPTLVNEGSRTSVIEEESVKTTNIEKEQKKAKDTDWKSMTGAEFASLSEIDLNAWLIWATKEHDLKPGLVKAIRNEEMRGS